MNTALLKEVERLSIQERIELVEAIWDTIPENAGPEVLPLPEAHRLELDRRLAELRVDPDSGIPWEEVRARLQRRQ